MVLPACALTVATAIARLMRVDEIYIMDELDIKLMTMTRIWKNKI